jgi:hypothetical protein
MSAVRFISLQGVHMRLGIGGGAFGVRGGISTRGVGVGVGPLSAGTSWRGRRSRKSGGGNGLIAFIIALVVTPFLSLCSHHSSEPQPIGQGTPGQYQPLKTAPPPPAGTCLTTPSLLETADGTAQKTNITLPDLVGLNAQVAEDQLKKLDLNDSMTSANPDYKMVLEAKNWMVVSMYPPAGCAVSPYDEVSLNVTKP